MGGSRQPTADQAQAPATTKKPASNRRTSGSLNPVMLKGAGTAPSPLKSCVKDSLQITVHSP